MKRGTLYGMYTFRESEHGKHVLIDWEEWRDVLGRLNTINATLHLANLRLTEPVTPEEIHEVREAIMSVINMGINEDGFQERRR